tara:strand:+ start:441 stop:1277 length:837 start_codon:yes stop_codon:yes gene_type:complete
MEIIDISNVKECRICFIDETVEPDKAFINPCACSGTSKWIHIECLNRWRNEGSNPNSESKCSECLTEYNIIRNNFDQETLIYKDSYIKNINICVGISSLLFSFIIYSLNTFYDGIIINIIGFGNTPNGFIDGESYMSMFIYIDIGAFFILISINISIIINILKHIKHKKIYFSGIRSKLLRLSIFNLLFFPLYQNGIFINSLDFVIFSYTILYFFITYTLKSLLIESNSIIKSINDDNYIEDTILPYGMITTYIQLDDIEDDIEVGIETSETFLLTDN